MFEENSMEGFKFIKEKLVTSQFNALVHQKEDVENPIFRVDMLIDKVTPK